MASVEQILHEAFAANAYLVGLLPASKLVTGTAKGLATPYATINREGNAPMARSNGPRIDRTIVRVTVWATHSTGSALRDELIKHWDNWSSESTTPRVLSMRKQNDLAIEEDDGIWQFLIDFEVVTQAR